MKCVRSNLRLRPEIRQRIPKCPARHDLSLDVPSLTKKISCKQLLGTNQSFGIGRLGGFSVEHGIIFSPEEPFHFGDRISEVRFSFGMLPLSRQELPPFDIHHPDPGGVILLPSLPVFRLDIDPFGRGHLFKSRVEVPQA